MIELLGSGAALAQGGDFGELPADPLADVPSAQAPRATPRATVEADSEAADPVEAPVARAATRSKAASASALSAPEIVSPSNEKVPPGKVRFEWEAVSGVKWYRFSLYGNGKTLRSENVQGTSRELKIDKPGKYTWEVRAMRATGKNVRDPASSGWSQGERSSDSFTVSRSAREKGVAGTISAGYQGLSFNHTELSPNFETTFGGSTIGAFVDGEAFLTDHIVVLGSLSSARTTFQGESSSFTNVQASAQYRGSFERTSFGYGLGLDLNRSTFPEIMGEVDSVTNQDVYSRHILTRLSVAPRAMLTMKVNPRTLVIAQVVRPFPISLSASDNVTLTKEDPGMVYRAGATLQGAWFWPFGVRVDAYVIRDGAKYLTTAGEYSVIYTGYELNAGLSYSF